MPVTSYLDPVCGVDPSSYIGKKNLGECLRLTPGGDLAFGGVNVLDFAHEHGTRHYLVDLKQVSSNAKRLLQSFRGYPGKFSPFYALKANSLAAVVERITAEGFGVEVTNIYELLFALDFLEKKRSKRGIPRIICNGVSKHQVQRPYKDSLIQLAFNRQVKDGYDVIVNLSSVEEVKFAAKVAHKLGGGLRVGVGVNPAVKPKTAEDLATGAGYSRFGVPVGNLVNILKEIKDGDDLKVTQLHCHIGSQVSNLDAIVGTHDQSENNGQGLLQILCSKVFELDKKLSVNVDQLNIGGGIPVRYVKTRPNDLKEYGEFWPSYDVEEYASEVTNVLKKLYEDEGVAQPELIIEPGRWPTANSTALVLTVTDVFEISSDFRSSLKGSDKWIITDGSAITDAHDTVLLQQWFEILNVSRIGKPLEDLYNIGGIACDSGDVFAWGRDRTGPRRLPQTKKDDILIVLDVGAYQQPLSSNYNMLPKAPTYNIDEQEWAKAEN